MSEVLVLGSGIRKMGLGPGDRAAIYAETSYIPGDAILIAVLIGK